jgi:hypothetical protein
VTLRLPPPLDTPLRVERDGDAVRLLDGDRLVAEARPAELELELPEPISYEEAERLSAAQPDDPHHPFPGCFVCGPDRPPPDGLGVFPGRLSGHPDTVASSWLPDGSLAGDDGTLPPHLVWAALDCTSGWSSDLVGRPKVLGRITAAVDAVPRIGEPCVVVGRHLRDDGRKTFTASTAYDSDGRVLGRAEALWIALRTGPGKSL